MKIPAYIDSSAGLLPCHVSESWERNGGIDRVRIHVQSPRVKALGFKTGDYWPVSYIVPRDKVTGRQSMRGPRILPYSWRDIFAAESR